MEEKKKIIYIILIILTLILLYINIKVFLYNYIDNSSIANSNEGNIMNTYIIDNTMNVTSEEEDEENRQRKIASLTERQRMQTYFGQYLSYIESKEYSKAYDLLYDGFKNSYFLSLNDFINYAQENYYDNMVVEYIDIEREGTIYILTVEIRDALNNNKETQVESKQVIISESELNNYKISFQL